MLGLNVCISMAFKAAEMSLLCLMPLCLKAGLRLRHCSQQHYLLGFDLEFSNTAKNHLQQLVYNFIYLTFLIGNSASGQLGWEAFLSVIRRDTL